MEIILKLFLALFLTVLIEGVLILIITKSKKFCYYSLLCNVLTNPLMNFIIILFSGVVVNKIIFIILLEIGVVILEGKIYSYISGKKFKVMLLLSLILNVASVMIGQMVNLLL